MVSLLGMDTDATLQPDPALLPDDPALLKALVVQLLEELQKANARLERQEHHMHLLLKRLYGSTSEKRDPRQGELFDSHGNGEDKVEEPAASVAIAAAPPASLSRLPRSVDQHGRGRIPERIQREEVVHDLSEAEMAAMGGAENLVELPAERSEQLDWRPSTLFVIVHVRKKYARRTPLPESGLTLCGAERGGGPQAGRGDSRRVGRAGTDGASDRLQGNRPFALAPPGRDLQAAGRAALAADDGRLVAANGRVPAAAVRLGHSRGAGFARRPHRRHFGEGSRRLAEREAHGPLLALCGRCAARTDGVRLHADSSARRTGRVS